jgi:hypothetical protein
VLKLNDYKSLLKLFNLPIGDYKRVMAFLRKHECHAHVPQSRTA